MAEVMSKEVAEQELDRILEFFDSEIEKPDRDNIVPAIMDGRISLDEKSQELCYRLARPIQKENSGEPIEEIRLHEPDSVELEYINKGQKLSVDSESRIGSMDLSDMYTKTIRMVVKLGGIPLGLANRLKRRDINVLKSLASFFG